MTQTPSQKLGHQILFLLKQFKELGVEEQMLRAAFRAFPNAPGDQMLFILGSMISQNKISDRK